MKFKNIILDYSDSSISLIYHVKAHLSASNSRSWNSFGFLFHFENEFRLSYLRILSKEFETY